MIFVIICVLIATYYILVGASFVGLEIESKKNNEGSPIAFIIGFILLLVLISILF